MLDGRVAAAKADSRVHGKRARVEAVVELYAVA